MDVASYTSYQLIGLGTKDQDKMVDGVVSKSRGNECDVHGLFQTGTCSVHKSHVDFEDEITIRTGKVPESPYNPFLEAKELEENLTLTHEFDVLAELSTALKPRNLDLIDAIDAHKVGQDMSMLRATPGSL